MKTTSIKTSTVIFAYFNSGRHLSTTPITTWTKLFEFRKVFFDQADNSWTGKSRNDNAYGFLKISHSLAIQIKNTTWSNHFFTSGTTSERPNYGSCVYFSNVFGKITISKITISEMTGLLGDYNINTLTVLSQLPSYGNNVTSYQFVPAITTDLTCKISEMVVSGINYNNNIANLGGSSIGGHLIHFGSNPTDGEGDVLDLKIDSLSSSDCYIYGLGGIVYQYGKLQLTNSQINRFGYTKPMTSTTQNEAPPIINQIRPDKYSKFDTLTVQESLGGIHGAALYIFSDTSQTVAPLGTNNFEVNSLTTTNWGGTHSVVKLSANSLMGLFTDLSMTQGVSTTLGALYITGGGTVTFDNATFNENIGSSVTDLSVTAWSACNLIFTGSTFTRTAIDTTGLTTYNKGLAFSVNVGGSISITNTEFSNYLMAALRGGAMYLSSVTMTLNNCTFNKNSASFGGAIYAESSTTLTITDSTFTNNEAGTNAGALYARSDCVITTQNWIFSKNKGAENGVISMLQNTKFNDNGSTFSSNQATISKSFGSINQGMGSVLEGTKFIGNSVGGSQGILLYNLLNDITFRNVNVTLSAGKR
jgi:predicted outer membrane repeat protein